MKRFSFGQALLRLLVAIFGSDLTDQRTGRKVARALMFCWRGRIYLLGLQGQDQVIPVFLPQERMTFWKRQIGFSTHPAPDDARETAMPDPDAEDKAICFLLLTHQAPEETERLIARWRSYCAPPAQLVLAYGGSRDSFGQISYEPKFFLDDPRLRTRDHQREKQSYGELFRKTAAWLREHPECGFVYLSEYDHWPLARNLGPRLIERLRREKADVLGHEFFRRDRTSCVYYLHHLADPRFLPWLREHSRRRDPEAVFNMLGTGSFWTREAFLAVADCEETIPIYLETYLPTLAHHLGFRVRDFQEQSRFVRGAGDLGGEIATARAAGAWTIHPVKSWPSASLEP
jgi:hypothetical protein